MKLLRCIWIMQKGRPDKGKLLQWKQWADKLDAFLEFNEQKLLTHAGKVKAEVARKIAEDRYEEFDKQREN